MQLLKCAVLLYDYNRNQKANTDCLCDTAKEK